MDEKDKPQGSKPLHSDMVSPVPGRRSPIRPENPDPPRPRLKPSVAKPTKPNPPTREMPRLNVNAAGGDTTLSPAEKAERAINTLREKMAKVAEEYSEGKINQAQFNAIYQRYSEQREITERLLQRNPDSGAWQSVVQTGHTNFLRDHFEAKVVSYGLYRIDNGVQITLQGKWRLPMEQLSPILGKLRRLVAEGNIPGAASRSLKDERWVMLIPGHFTASVAIFSLEPAPIQRQLMEDIHRDFERANQRLLAEGEFDVAQLVFPHRTLFEQQ